MSWGTVVITKQDRQEGAALGQAWCDISRACTQSAATAARGNNHLDCGADGRVVIRPHLCEDAVEPLRRSKKLMGVSGTGFALQWRQCWLHQPLHGRRVASSQLMRSMPPGWGFTVGTL